MHFKIMWPFSIFYVAESWKSTITFSDYLLASLKVSMLIVHNHVYCNTRIVTVSHRDNFRFLKTESQLVTRSILAAHFRTGLSLSVTQNTVIKRGTSTQLRTEKYTQCLVIITCSHSGHYLWAQPMSDRFKFARRQPAVISPSLHS